MVFKYAIKFKEYGPTEKSFAPWDSAKWCLAFNSASIIDRSVIPSCDTEMRWRFPMSRDPVLQVREGIGAGMAQHRGSDTQHTSKITA